MKSFARTRARLADSAVFHVLILVVLGAFASAHAGETQLNVTATVVKSARLKVLAQPASVVVTAADLARGYVDVPADSQVAIESNTNGYMLEFSNAGDFMRQILVRGLNGDVQLSPAGGLVTQRPGATGVSKTTLALGYRFLLAESARQGTYAWPMRLSVTPL